MNREIKFRAWSTFKKSWIDFPLVMNLEGLVMIPEGGWDLNGDWEEPEKLNIVLMQYTGLKDKNGNEIYFGDRLKVLDVVGMEFILFDWLEDCNLLLCIENGTYQVEVIGNIYENPELIK